MRRLYNIYIFALTFWDDKSITVSQQRDRPLSHMAFDYIAIAGRVVALTCCLRSYYTNNVFASFSTPLSYTV